MKRAYRERAMSRLYAELASADFDLREHALFRLVLMLRRSQNATASADWTDYGNEHLSRDLIRIRLSPADQERIVSHLAQMIATHAESRASAFWALSEVMPQTAFATVTSAIAEYGDQLTDEAAFQACGALQKCLESDEAGASHAIELLAELRASQVLRRWSRATEVRLAKIASAVIKLAQRLSE